MQFPQGRRLRRHPGFQFAAPLPETGNLRLTAFYRLLQSRSLRTEGLQAQGNLVAALMGALPLIAGLVQNLLTLRPQPLQRLALPAQLFALVPVPLQSAFQGLRFLAVLPLLQLQLAQFLRDLPAPALSLLETGLEFRVPRLSGGGKLLPLIQLALQAPQFLLGAANQPVLFRRGVFQGLDVLRQLHLLPLQAGQFLLAGQHAGGLLSRTINADPVVVHPDAVPGRHGLILVQFLANLPGLRQVLRHIDPAQRRF